MSNVVELIPAAVERGLIPLCLSREVQIIPFMRALRLAGLDYRYDTTCKAVIIEQQKDVEAISPRGSHEGA